MKYVILVFFVGLTSIGFSQKNTFSVEHSTILSKLFFEEAIEDFYDRNTGLFSFYYKQSELNKPFITNSFSFSYKRKISENIQIGIKGRKIERGLQSSYSFNIVSIQDTASLKDTYGGFNMIYRLKSHEIGLSFDYTLFTNKILNFRVGLHPAWDVYNRLEVKTNTFNRSQGLSQPTGILKEHFNSGKDRFLERFKENVAGEFYRASLYVSGIIEYQTIIQGLSLTSSLEIGGSTPLRTQDPAPLSFLPDGWILLASLQLGVAYTF